MHQQEEEGKAAGDRLTIMMATDSQEAAELEAEPKEDVTEETEQAAEQKPDEVAAHLDEGESDTEVHQSESEEGEEQPKQEQLSASDAVDVSQTMEELLEEGELPRFQRGDIKKGVVVDKTPDEILIDIGAKSEGVVTGRELERLGPAASEKINVGDEVLVYILSPQDRFGRVLLSLTRAQIERDWNRVEKLRETGEVIERPVAGANKGGVIVRIGRLRGFVPASQLTREHRTRPSDSEQVDADQRWAHLIGEQLSVKVLEIDRRRNRLILSERAAYRDSRRKKKEELVEELRPGQVVEGRVSSLCDFGAFVDIGGADGLVHLSELAWQHVRHPEEVLQVGDEVRVQVLSVDRERNRIGLSIKRLLPEPWETVTERYYVSQLVDAVVTKITDFGAFAQLEDGIEGLIHISELSDRRIGHPTEVVKEGDKITVRIIRIEPERRRIGLSLRRVTDPEYADVDWQFAADMDDWFDDDE